MTHFSPTDAPSDPRIGRRSFIAAGLASSLVALPAVGRAGVTAPRSTVDAQGVWRWADGREVALFGVNYDLASASAFRFAKASGVPFDKIIDADFAHFKRLDFDALRLCFWGDWEATTADGHLVENEHLAVLDQLLARAERAGLSCLLSPIVTYDASWPDAMEQPRSGVASAFKKEVLGTDGAAIAAQARYLGELLSRTNTRTGRRLADEPAIVAIEPINEPYHHSKDQSGSVRYIDTLARAVRSAGFDGPIFYNVTQDMAMAPAIAAADVQGATFAWYPTGLQTGHAVAGNGLLLVDDYAQFGEPALTSRAKLVYEFDAADSMAGYFYPAMVRAFRGGGAQFAAMFAYDALPIAASNSEFNDHILNLAYTPAKALSALIAATAMRALPRGMTFGHYPANMRFDGFRVDDRANLSEFHDGARFYHSNDTDTRPDARGLTHLAGCGSSPLVSYDGTGAWFLDKVADGVWRLEVYPDAAVTANPFVFRRPARSAVRIVARQRRVRLDLPDLGRTFAIATPDGAAVARARDGAFEIGPGVYRLSRGATSQAIDPTFHAPAGESFAPILQHVPPPSVVAGRAVPIELQIVSPQPPRRVTVQVRSAAGLVAIPMTAGRGFAYHASIPAGAVKAGWLDYYVTMETADVRRVAPATEGTWPGDWDFPRQGGYRVPVVAADAPLVLFDAARDGDQLIVPYGGYATVPGIGVAPAEDGGAVLRLDGTMLKAAAHNDLPAQLAWDGALNAQGRELGALTTLAVTGRAVRAGPVTVILIERDGMAWGATLTLGAATGSARVELAALTPVEAAMLPRDFPVGINPYWLRTPAGRGGAGDRVRLAELQAVQITLGARFLGGATPLVEVSRISLSR